MLSIVVATCLLLGTTPFSGTPAVIPGTIEAEHF